MLQLSILLVTVSFVVSVTSQECSCTASCNKPHTCSVPDTEGVLLKPNSSDHNPLNCIYVPKSCAEIKQLLPNSLSGYYTIATDVGRTKTVYCQMGPLCGTDGPWTRVAHLDMSDPREECPGKLREYSANGVRVCGRPVTSTGSCSSVYFDVTADPYSQVGGRITGYQYYTTSAAQAQAGRSIDTYYVDGISLTKGSPREHIWTFMTGLNNDNPSLKHACPCATQTSQSSPSFVGNNYFCESGNPSSGYPKELHTSDPLWDGKNCGTSEAPCCNVPGIPWFSRNFNTTTTDFLELRVCCDQDTSDEDSPFGNYELYVK